MEIKLMSLKEMADTPLSDELVPGLMDTGMVLAIADPGAGKTFFGVYVAALVASGATWQGRKVKQGPVVYCIAEGVSHFTYRVTTAFDELGVRANDMPFYVLNHSINMRSAEDGSITEEILKLGRAISELPTPTHPRLIVLDTLSRFMPGGDENNQKDASAMVRGCDYLKEAFPESTVLIMHHLKKGDSVARGSTVFTGAADQVLFAKKAKGELTEKPVLWTTTGPGKRKDRGPVNQWFEFVEVPMSKGAMVDYKNGEDDFRDFYVMTTDYDEHGEERETSVVEQTLVMRPCDPPEDGQKEEMNENEAELLAFMQNAGEEIRVRKTFMALGWSSTKFYKAANALEAAGLIEQTEDKGFVLVDQKRTGNPFLPGRP